MLIIFFLLTIVRLLPSTIEEHKPNQIKLTRKTYMKYTEERGKERENTERLEDTFILADVQNATISK